MNGYAVLKGASYTLAVTPDMVIHNGTTQTTEMIVNPESEYLKELPSHLRSFEDAVNYLHVQCQTLERAQLLLQKAEWLRYVLFTSAKIAI